MPVITFSNFLHRLQFVGAKAVKSPPAPKGSIWLFGKRGNADTCFPFDRGPMYPIASRPDGDIVPRIIIEKILQRLEFNEEDQALFWRIQDHMEATPVSPEQTQKP